MQKIIQDNANKERRYLIGAIFFCQKHGYFKKRKEKKDQPHPELGTLHSAKSNRAVHIGLPV